MTSQIPMFGLWTSRHCVSMRVFRLGLQIKGPASPPLFSERHGMRRTLLRIFGWRLMLV
jgi:hypothetical protein